MRKSFSVYLLAVIVFLAPWGCMDNWEDHLRLNDGVASDNLAGLLASFPDLQAFAQLVESTGWTEELGSTKSFTVYAPTNEAMSKLTGINLDDSATASSFVRNHICFTAYTYQKPQDLKKVKTFSGKYIHIDTKNGKVNEVPLLEPFDIMATNGVLHKINTALVPKPNLWEIIETTALCQAQAGYLTGMTGMVFDPSRATIVGVDPISGKPVYDTLSGMVWNNPFITYIRDLRVEDSLSTVFLIEDQVFASEFVKYRPYFELDDPVLSDSLTLWSICRDLVFRGQIPPDEMPDTILSLFQTKIPFSQSAVVQTMEASNGIVYVLNSCNVRLQDKIPPIIIEGEDPARIITVSLTGQTGYKRQKPQASGGYDFILDNHGANPANIRYNMGKVCATTYKFYWKAVNDFDGSYRNPNPDLVLQQQLFRVRILGMAGKNIIWSEPSQISPAMIPVSDSTYDTAKEVYAGELVLVKYQDLWLQVTGGGNNMTITLDYLKAVPVYK